MATVEQANAEIATIADQLVLAYPETNRGWGAGARELRRQIFSDEFRTGSTIAAVAVAFVLLIASANVANLMLARVASRGREIAVRGALGAPLAAVPGVESVGGTTLLPRQGNNNTFFEMPGRETGNLRDRPLTEMRIVFPGYFTAMGTPLVRGRTCGDQDLPSAPPVAVVNQELAERYWPDDDPIGKQLRAWGQTYTVVGVTRNTLDNGRDPRPMTFLSAFQYLRSNMGMVLRTSGEPSSVVPSVRAAVLGLDHDLPATQVDPLEALRTE